MCLVDDAPVKLSDIESLGGHSCMGVDKHQLMDELIEEGRLGVCVSENDSQPWKVP